MIDLVVTGCIRQVVLILSVYSNTVLVFLTVTIMQMNKHRFRVQRSSNELKMKESSSSHDNSHQVSTGIPWPPGKWRLGIPSEHAKWLFMRFATKG